LVHDGPGGVAAVNRFDPDLIVLDVMLPGFDGWEVTRRVRTKPVVVYFHGGGFVIANLDTYDASCRAIANAAGCLVLATLTPEGDATASIEQFADAKPLNAAMLDWFASYYAPDPANAAEPAASPLNASDLSDLPPATVILAGIDPRHSQGELYAAALSDAGVDTTVTTL
jgi:acetyl esterase/lipase